MERDPARREQRRLIHEQQVALRIAELHRKRRERREQWWIDWAESQNKPPEASRAA